MEIDEPSDPILLRFEGGGQTTGEEYSNVHWTTTTGNTATYTNAADILSQSNLQ